MFSKILLIGTLLFGWACRFTAYAQPIPVKHSIGLVAAPVLYSTGDRWGKSLGIQYEATFGPKETVSLVSSLAFLQKSISSVSFRIDPPTMSAHYAFDLGAKLNVRILGGRLSFLAGYGVMTGYEILSGSTYLTTYSAASPVPRFYILNAMPTSSGVDSPTLRSAIYHGAVTQLQYEYELSRKLALGGQVKIRLMSRNRPTENNQVNTFGLLLKYRLN